jgi:hypothetical protein
MSVTTIQAPPTSDPFDSDLHAQWKRDRALRHRVPLGEAWRGCLGLAVLLDRPDDTVAHGDLALARNGDVTWLALRDVPVGRCPGSPVLNRRDVNYANATRAELRYGLPVIDFARGDLRGAVDFKFIPSAPHVRRLGPAPWDTQQFDPRPDALDAGRRRREFAILNRMSARMTEHAFFALDAGGRPARRPWAAHRPPEGRTFRPEPPRRWMPRPYLAFRAAQAAELFRHIARGHQGESAADRPLRHYPVAFRDGFCAAVGRGLPLRATGPEVYRGTVARPGAAALRGDDCRDLRLVPHTLESGIDGRARTVFLPRHAAILAAVNEALEAGATWARVLPDPAPDRWRRRGRVERWATLHEACGGTDLARHLQRVWLADQFLRVADDPAAVLAPAELVATAATEVRPTALWWDTAPALPFYDWESRAAVFPPLRVWRWNRLTFCLPADVAMDASIADPRFGWATTPETAIHRVARAPARATAADGTGALNPRRGQRRRCA